MSSFNDRDIKLIGVVGQGCRTGLEKFCCYPQGSFKF
jgi:hypothetical protein